jgi:hypothetical protein
VNPTSTIQALALYNVPENCLVIRAGHAVFSAGGHHDAGKPAQIPAFRRRQFGSSEVAGKAI